jgi:hypothetical protein|tara:strand:+ start:3279 stop:3464 length:186 start_codon:yes stop_codon:yes gene_type:complete
MSENFELEVFRKKVLDELTNLRCDVLYIQDEADRIVWKISELQDELVEFFEKSEDEEEEEE